MGFFFFRLLKVGSAALQALGFSHEINHVGVDFVRTSGFCSLFIHEINHVCVVRRRTTGFVAASYFVWYSPYELVTCYALAENETLCWYCSLTIKSSRPKAIQ